MRTALLTVLALVAFAANSVLCRLALGPDAIDAASFTALRLASGAAALVLLVSLRRGFGPRGRGGSWGSAGALFLYAAPFSLAYRGLPVGTGALLLFGSVQITMIAAALYGGEGLSPMRWIGLVVASGGLVVLFLPGLAAPPLGEALLMILAGVAWGIYSLRGRAARDPLTATTDNFVRAVPLGLLLAGALPLAGSPWRISGTGVLLAVVSGAVTSGIGYLLWYAALPGLAAARAAAVQLTVPVLAAAGGVLFLGETVTPRLVGASALVLGGVAAALSARALSREDRLSDRDPVPGGHADEVDPG